MSDINFSDLLCFMDIAILEKTDNGYCKIYGEIPAWFMLSDRSELEIIKSESKDFMPEDYYPFLESFFVDADEFWDTKPDDVKNLRSDTWIETDKNGSDFYLEASAINFQGKKLLLIERLGQYFMEKVKILQKGREKLLEQEDLTKSNRKLSKEAEVLRDISFSDELTGLYNRRGFVAMAEKLLRASMREKNHSLLLFFDLDGLKQINDKHGHKEGSEAIVNTGKIIELTFRDSDVLSRFGGDEFVVLAMNTDEENNELILDRLQKQVDLHNANSDKEYDISISVGIENWNPDNPQNLDELIEKADAIMYEQKRTKKG